MRRHLVDLSHEEFWIILTARSQKVITKELMSKGGLSNTVIDPKIIFSTALLHKASHIILIHNHPSGNLKPSHNDIALTKNLIAAGQVLEIKIMDHLIISDGGFFSMADEGVI